MIVVNEKHKQLKNKTNNGQSKSDTKKQNKAKYI